MGRKVYGIKGKSEEKNIIHTHGPLLLNNPIKHPIHLILIPRPLPADQRHSHGPQPPAQKRHPLELFLRKPAAATQHAGAQGEGLDHVEIRPFDVVADDDGAFAGWERVACDADVGAVLGREDALDVRPDCAGYKGGEVVGCGWEEVGEGQEEGEEGVG